MTPRDLFDDCRLTEAIAAQREIVRSCPGDASELLLLGEFLAFAGRRAETLEVLARIDASDAAMAAYLAGWRQIIAADDARHAGRHPNWITLPSPDFKTRVALISRRNDETEDIDLLEELNEEAPWLVGHVDGREFDGCREADDILAPILEAFRGGHYIWIPLEAIRKVRFADEDVLRDRLYRPATVWLDDRSEWQLIVPALYVGSAAHADEAVRVGASTDWRETSGLLRGSGLKTFLFGDEELAIGEFTQVEIRPS